MERQQYTVTAAELPRQIKRLGVPQRAIIHFWYELEKPEIRDGEGKKKVRKSMKDTPAFGMWANRADMQDPSAYVRELRKPRSFG